MPNQSVPTTFFANANRKNRFFHMIIKTRGNNFCSPLPCDQVNQSATFAIPTDALGGDWIEKLSKPGTHLITYHPK